MPRHLLKRLIPERHVVHNNRLLQLFGRLLHDGNLWHLNRHSVSGAVAVGLFWALIPLPVQTLMGAACAIYFRVNLPMTLMLVWLTNPITIPPVFYLCYELGSWLVPGWSIDSEFHLSLDWIMESTTELFAPTLLGGLIIGSTLSVIGYFSMQAFWRWHVLNRYKKRQSERGDSKPSAN